MGFYFNRLWLVFLLLLLLCSYGTVVLGEEVCELLVRALLEHGLLPEVWGQVGVGLGDGSVRGLSEVAQSTGGTLGTSVAVLNTSHLMTKLHYTSYTAGNKKCSST